jgi:uncharacterized protein YndB with AHSA1/START domain
LSASTSRSERTSDDRVDLRAGGKVRVVMRRPDGTEVGASGEYTLIDRPQRLEITWTFDDDPSNRQLIELSFSESEGSTTVVMINSGTTNGSEDVSLETRSYPNGVSGESLALGTTSSSGVSPSRRRRYCVAAGGAPSA